MAIVLQQNYNFWVYHGIFFDRPMWEQIQLLWTEVLLSLDFYHKDSSRERGTHRCTTAKRKYHFRVQCSHHFRDTKKTVVSSFRKMYPHLSISKLSFDSENHWDLRSYVPSWRTGPWCGSNATPRARRSCGVSGALLGRNGGMVGGWGLGYHLVNSHRELENRHVFEYLSWENQLFNSNYYYGHGFNSYVRLPEGSRG